MILVRSQLIFDKDDKFHRKIVEFIKDKKFRFVTTTAVLTEITHLLDFSVEAQINFFQWILNNGVTIEEVGISDIARIIELTKKYSDQPMDFADATLVVVAERTGIKKIISIDSDFDIYRLPGKVRIENVFG
ncbi:MAG TPA: PIN domain-containing protein [Candidatus Competibacteraceae bacterium]|nr:PIN domain-containing protein [Candidatus Competibacteraceae bacterium]HRZ04641.1 PIN domain-containing protein [Candidatus Competibacteraceae bacterium]HSA44937.1 PIN domain-containing protein [Candidatus Competibacteraceae bacterium]